VLWLTLSLFAAFAQATADALSKKALAGSDVFMVAWLRNLLAVPFLAAVFFIVPVPRLDPTFYWAVGLALPLSLTMPFLALTPFYLLATSFLILGETPSRAGAAGVALLGAGAYLLNIHTLKEGGVLAPFKAVYREKGSLMMMAVAAIYAITSDLGKLAILHSSPAFFGAAYVAVFALVFTPVALAFSKKPFALPRGKAGLYLLIGGSIAALAISQTIALSMTQVSYMIAVKRTSLLFSVGYGWFMFRETNIKERLIGGSVMLGGLVLISAG